MKVTIWLCILMWNVVNPAKWQGKGIQTDRDYMFIVDPLSHHEQKRSPRQNAAQAVKIGTEAIEKLLRKTKVLYTNGYDQVLVKAGGYKQALSDFKSIDPDVMTETKTEVLGSKGNLDIKLQDGELPKMTFTSRSLYQSHFLDKPPEYIIFYQPKLSKNK